MEIPSLNTNNEKIMKKYIYVAISTVVFFAQTTQAQDSNQVTYKTDPKGIFGVRFMPSVSSISVRNFDGSVGGDFVLGYGFGGLFGFNFNQHAGIQLEIIYNQLSQKYQDHNLSRRIDINYINIPLLLSLNTNRLKPVNFNIVAGPQFGVNVGARLMTTGTPNGNSNTNAILAVKKSDFGIAYGAGLDFGLNHMHTIRLDVGFRGVMGLVDVSDRSGTLQTNSYYILQKNHIETYSAYAGLTFLF